MKVYSTKERIFLCFHSYSFQLYKFHDFPGIFHELLKFSINSGLSWFQLNLGYVLIIPCSTYTLWCLPKCVDHATPTLHPLFALFNYLSPSYIILVLTSVVTNLPNKLQFSMTFQDKQLNSMTFQVCNMEFVNFMTFQVYHDPYKP